jgi:hypothetical protein
MRPLMTVSSRDISAIWRRIASVMFSQGDSA